MHPLIPIQLHQIDGVLQETVDARDLWNFFKPYSPFANWIRGKLLQHKSFVENRDYVRIKVERKIHYGCSSRISYQIDYMMAVPMAEAIGDSEFCRDGNSWK